LGIAASGILYLLLKRHVVKGSRQLTESRSLS
jgi:hypothetical protein